MNTLIMAHTYLYIFIAIVSVSFVFGLILDQINANHWCKGLPERLKTIITAEEYQKSISYYKQHESLSKWQESFSFVLILLVLIYGGFGWLDQALKNISDHFILLPLMFFGSLGLLSGLLSLPFEIYSTFVIEDRFGFNKTTPKTYVLDKLKGIVLSVIIGGGLLSLIITIYHYTGNWFWILALGVTVVFSIFSVMFYSTLIVPLFNKQKPLEEGETRLAIESFAQKTGFKLDNIFVIDGSKRSTKANAYFTGFGKKKRIVLYDTLINNHTTNELVAILAHEIGHYKNKHIIKGMVLSFIQSGVVFFLLSRFIDPSTVLAHNICAALGASQPNFHIGVLAFGLLYSPISTIISCFTNLLSRHFEFQADSFAGTHCDPNDLQQALKRLSVDHLSNLNPHPLYVFIHYSHPPLISRLEGLEKLKNNRI
jgi:STE24 endopeptidase